MFFVLPDVIDYLNQETDLTAVSKPELPKQRHSSSTVR